MRFMVEIDAGMEKANAIDAAGGPGAMPAKETPNNNCYDYGGRGLIV